jgi:hypothetical protein
MEVIALSNATSVYNNKNNVKNKNEIVTAETETTTSPQTQQESVNSQEVTTDNINQMNGDNTNTHPQPQSSTTTNINKTESAIIMSNETKIIIKQQNTTTLHHNGLTQTLTYRATQNGRFRKPGRFNMTFKEENIKSYTDANGVCYKISGKS